jgi:hypothetical protein
VGKKLVPHGGSSGEQRELQDRRRGRPSAEASAKLRRAAEFRHQTASRQDWEERGVPEGGCYSGAINVEQQHRSTANVLFCSVT